MAPPHWLGEVSKRSPSICALHEYSMKFLAQWPEIASGIEEKFSARAERHRQLAALLTAQQMLSFPSVPFGDGVLGQLQRDSQTMPDVFLLVDCATVGNLHEPS
eukprot:12427116-Karenia_brevis.AAC.1